MYLVSSFIFCNCLFSVRDTDQGLASIPGTLGTRLENKPMDGMPDQLAPFAHSFTPRWQFRVNTL